MTIAYKETFVYTVTNSNLSLRSIDEPVMVAFFSLERQCSSVLTLLLDDISVLVDQIIIIAMILQPSDESLEQGRNRSSFILVIIDNDSFKLMILITQTHPIPLTNAQSR